MRLIFSLALGALTPFSIAPYSHWWLGIITLGAFAILLSRSIDRLNLFKHSACFGVGYFTTGLYWIYHSIYVFGSAPAPLAWLLMATFIAFLALVFALPFLVLSLIHHHNIRLLLGFPLCWALSEWLRGWIFTGLPWLYMGYSHFDTLLIGWAPIGGVLLVGLLSVLTSAIGAAVASAQFNTRRNIQLMVFVSIFWSVGGVLNTLNWTEADGQPLTVGMVQPNVALENKWDPRYREPTIDILMALSEPLWGEVDWLFWPEAAIPDLYHRADDLLPRIDEQARNHNTLLVTGVLFDDYETQKIYNSVVGLGQAEGIYLKQRLVPFGEYVPLEDWLRGLIDFFDLPNSFISAGHAQQENIKMGEHILAAAICYEIVYPALVAEQSRNAHAILTVSNDAWFGDSIGPLQHFHIARMRAMETGRYVIRATNNGVTAIIDNRGKINARNEQFRSTYLKGSIIPMTGETPYMRWKDNLFLLLLAFIAIAIGWWQIRLENASKTQS